MTAKTKKPEKDSYVDKALNNEDPQRPEPVQYDKIKEGDLMAFIYYGTIKSKDFIDIHESVQVAGVAGAPSGFHVHGKDLIEVGFSADQFNRTEKLSKTAIAEILTTSYNRPFTVCFEKQDGTERILRGRLVQPETLLGRSHVEDLDIKEGNNLRLVDHRTLKFLIVNGVKYIVK